MWAFKLFSLRILELASLLILDLVNSLSIVLIFYFWFGQLPVNFFDFWFVNSLSFLFFVLFSLISYFWIYLNIVIWSTLCHFCFCFWFIVPFSSFLSFFIDQLSAAANNNHRHYHHYYCCCCVAVFWAGPDVEWLLPLMIFDFWF